MDYTLAIKGLLSEVKQFVQFKGKSLACKILLIIAILPLIICAFSTVATYYILLFFYRGLSSPLEYIHQVVKKEGEDVKHATQFIIYWIAFPLLFLLYFVQAFAALMFYFIWFEIMFFTYLATLGGVRWQPFLMDVKYEEVKKFEAKPKNELAALIYVSITLTFVLLLVIFIIAEAYSYLVPIIGYSVMLFIVNPIMFRKALPQAPVEVPAQAPVAVAENTENSLLNGEKTV